MAKDQRDHQVQEVPYAIDPESQNTVEGLDGTLDEPAQKVPDSALATGDDAPAATIDDEPAVTETETDDTLTGKPAPAASAPGDAPPNGAPPGTPGEATDPSLTGDPDKQNLEKKLEQTGYAVKALTDRVEQALSTIQGQGGEATAAQQEELQELATEVADLDALELSDNEFEYLNEPGAKTLDGNVRKVHGSVQQLATVVQEQAKQITALQTQLQQSTDANAQTLEDARAAQFWTAWDRANPELAGRGPELWGQAREQAAQDIQGLGLDESQIDGAAAVTFRTLTEAQKAEAVKPGPKPRRAATPPPSTRPQRSTAGTKVTTPRGAPTSDFFDDDDLVPDEALWSDE